MKHQLLVSALAMALALPSFANTKDHPAPIKAMQERGVEILDTFDAPSGLKGYTGIYQGRPLALYVTSDGKHALIGSLLNDKAEDLTGPILQEKVSRPQGEAFWKELETTNWIKEGSDKADKIVYVFTDPNCPYCKRFWNSAQPWVTAGKVQLRHVVVGILSESSQKKAGYILTAKDKTQALTGNESGKQPAKETALTDEMKQLLQTNMNMMQKMGANGTPAIFYKDSTGMLQMQPGMPNPEMLVQMFGELPKK
ncbi:thiol:disulfide interchange protein DsbG [Pseudomonas sp. F1_0610]|uniref:thiol:disulfide interchange protein DsbG n=1 Tax=Pseudomonas sp. F1_0610 TaxID=3114284 RepID=UPI0039C1882D